MNFKKIKFNSKDKTLELSYTQFGADSNDEITIKCSAIVHIDFINAINALRYHFAVLCDLRELDIINSDSEMMDITSMHEHSALSQIKVSSVSFFSCGEESGVCLSGGKTFDNKYINMTSPSTVLNCDNYIHCYELIDALEALKNEARMYLTEQKWGIKQTELEFGLEAEFESAEQLSYENSVVETIEKIPSKRGRKPATEPIQSQVS